jgi:hypothetical protein
MGALISKIFEKRLIEKNTMEKCNEKLDDLENPLTEDEIEKMKSMKDSSNILQGIYKLILNSAYGKLIIKKSTTERVNLKHAYNSPGMHEYVYNHFNLIEEIIPLNKYQCTIIKTKFDDSYNLAHAGVMTLSYSKRIMNEVMGLANDNGIKVYYQDTDSMHLEKADVGKLENLYLKTYGKTLAGINMGNFHSDFELKGSVKKLKGSDEKHEVYSTKSIFLGKKCYMDYVAGVDKNGKVLAGYHLRMKGITEAGLEDAKDEYGSYDAVYERLAKGETINFTLNPESKDKVMFEYTQQGVQTRTKFVRKVNFKKIIV